MWIGSGLIPALFTPYNVLLDYFAASGITGTAAEMVLIGSLGIDVALGMGMLVRKWAAPIYLLQIGLMIFYTVFLSITAPEWWLHPYGPLLKNIPLIAATGLLLMAYRGRHHGS